MSTLSMWYAAALIATMLLVPVCRAAAIRWGYVAHPRGDRWHTRQTALLGGVAIVSVVLLGALAIRPFERVALFVVGGGAIAAVGLIDDLISLRPYGKLVAQVAVASIFVTFGYRLHWVDSLTLDTMLTLTWLVGVTNAFNLLDNMDGLCGGIGVIVSVTLMLDLSLGGGSYPLLAYLALLTGALTGFLAYNFNPASIFMGDSGSLFIGLTLAAMPLAVAGEGVAGSSVLSVIGAPILVLLIPIFDTTFVTVMRLLSGRSPSQGGRDHSSHRLVAIGLSERAAVRVLWTLAAFGGLIGLGLRGMTRGLAAPLAAAFILAMVIFAVYLARVRVYEDAADPLIRAGRITPFVADFMYKRRVAEVLLDLCLIPLCYYAAYRLRFEGPEYRQFFPRFIESLPIVVGVQLTALFAVGGYRGVWRYFGLMDAVVFGKGVALGTASIVVAIVYFYRFAHYSRGVFIIYAVLLMLALVASRASFRLISEFVRRRRGGRRLVIYGAGNGGALLLREFLNDRNADFRILGFIDDDPAKRNARILGYSVLGGFDTLTALLDTEGVDSVVVSTRTIEPERLVALESICGERGISLARLHFEIQPLVAS